MSSIDRICVPIRLGKRDAYLKRWLVLAKEYDCQQTEYFKLSLTSFLKGNSCVIGKVYPFADVSVNDNKTTTITFSAADNELYDWIKEQSEKNTKISTTIKHILSLSIKNVETPSEEGIPSYTALALEGREIYPQKPVKRLNDGYTQSETQMRSDELTSSVDAKTAPMTGGSVPSGIEQAQKDDLEERRAAILRMVSANTHQYL